MNLKMQVDIKGVFPKQVNMHQLVLRCNEDVKKRPKSTGNPLRVRKTSKASFSTNKVLLSRGISSTLYAHNKLQGSTEGMSDTNWPTTQTPT